MPSPSKKNNVVSISRPKRVLQTPIAAAVSQEDIARRAYEIYEARGRNAGSPFDDWVLAEQELNSLAAIAVPKKKRAAKTSKGQ